MSGVITARWWRLPVRWLAPPWLPGPGHLLLAGATAAAGLSILSLWWAAPTAVCAFLAGWRPGRTRSTALALVAAVAAGVVALSLAPASVALGSRLVGVVAGAAVLPWFVARFCRQYRDLIRAGWERAEHLEREQRLVAEQARLRERARIAQDMHDVIGHELSLIALSAGALKLAPGLPEPHRAVAQDIRARAAAAVDRLGEVIGVLRHETDAAPKEPGDAGIAGLVDRARAAGLAVELRVEGAADGLPPMGGRAVHRVVQEALTNVAKHAPGAAATVRVRHTPGETEVHVENGPAPADVLPAARGPAGTGGFGLIGLDERVRLAGGSLTHGDSRGDGGFAVRARLPRPPPAQPSPAGGPVAPVPPERRHARRGLRRTLVAGALVPLVTAAVLTGGLTVWNAVEARQTVLSPEDFDRLHTGQSRAEVAGYLPARQSEFRPAEPEPRAPGTACEYYAMTDDPFDDRSGDIYRLCFRTGTLISAEAFLGSEVR
ncbi:sensor histidine kinase [Streptomyces sp. SBT349]|uniref:sensor histidine kinase n=1 Tax=Streptomyces sp. SBT349 TaxID=1580539 RepID=UPI000D14AB23|nr:sensor histidine kinase [Streptomyces sp. SBT349]